MIKVEDLRKSYGNVLALDGVDFEVGRGETFGLLGPNGAGKTTIIRLLCGLLSPDTGSVSLDGRTNPMLAEVRLSLGVVPQTTAIYEEISAEQNLTFFGSMYGLKGKDLRERVEHCLELSGLSQRRKDRVSKYSGGMKRRLNMVCGLLHQPQYLLLDEPTVGVDPQSRNLIFDTIEAMKSEGHTIIYTTHYMEEAQRLCDRVAILDHGKILDMDSVENLIAKHGGPSRVEAEFEEKSMDVEKVKPFVKGENLQFEQGCLRFETTQPLESLAQLNRSGVHFISLKIETANLEDVFLNLTGRRLRDL